MPQPQADVEKEVQVEQKKQIDDMLSSMRRGPEPTPEPEPAVDEDKPVDDETPPDDEVVDEPVEPVDEPEPEEVVDDEIEPADEAVGEEDEEEEIDVTPEEPVEKPEPEEEDGSWRQQLNKMALEQLDDDEPAPTEPEPEAAPAPVEKPVEKPAPAEFTISDDEYNSAMTEKSGFDNIMQKTHDYQERRLQELIRAIPPVINDIVDNVVKFKFARADFYHMNEDLIPFKPLVQLTANKMFAKNPSMDPDKLFEKIGEEVRKALKMKKGSVSAPVKKTKDEPAFVKKSSSRKPQPPELKGMKGEIARMMNATNR